MAPPFQKFPLGIRLVFMFFMLVFNMGIVAYIAILFIPKLFGIDQPETLYSSIPKTLNQVNAFLFIQAISSMGGFMLTAVMFAQLESGRAGDWLKLNRPVPVKIILLAVFAVLVAQFFIDFLVEVNSKIPLPASLKYLAESQKEMEQKISAILNFKQFGQFIIVSFVIAVIPALGEEMFFRGLLLGDLLKAKVHPAVAITVTGFIFSIAHAEYNNILAIWALGAFLGYLYYISGSLWLPIAAHFVNNFLEVLAKYLYNIGVISSDVAEASTPVYITIVSILIFAGCIFVFNKWKVQPDFAEPEDDTEFTNETLQ